MTLTDCLVVTLIALATELASPPVVSVLAATIEEVDSHVHVFNSLQLSHLRIIYELTHEVRTRKIRTGSDLWHDVYTLMYCTYVHTFHPATILGAIHTGSPQLIFFVHYLPS